MIHGGGGDNWTTGAISRAKLQSNHHHQQTNIQLLLLDSVVIFYNWLCMGIVGS